MKIILIIFFLPFYLFAQTDSTKAVESVAEDTTAKVWEVSFNLGLNLSHTLQLNAKPNAGKEGFSTTNGLDLNLNYTKKKLIATNEFHWQFALYKAGLKQSYLQKTADELLSLHDFSIGFTKKNRWNINLIAKTSTSVIKSYKDGFLKDSIGGNIFQQFLNPYDVVLAPGIKYQPTKYLRFSISPLTIRLYGLTNQAIANTGLYIEEKNDDNLTFKKFISEKQGAELNLWYDRKVKKFITMQYRLGVKSNYAENLLHNGKIDGLFITKVKIIKNIYLTHRASLKGDLTQRPFKPNYLQVITLSYAMTL
jgi:hypothetical protein